VAKKKTPWRKPLTDEQKEEFRKNWLAPAASVQEKQFLRKWASQNRLSEKDRALILAWIDTPDGFDKRNEGFWRASKKSVLGDVVYERAMERQSDLPWHEWLVACLTTQGIKQEEIGDLIGRGERTVNTIISDLKQRIVQELNCDIESVNLAQISRWFLGL